MAPLTVAQRDYPAAESAFRAALAINPELPAATRDLAQLYIATHRLDELQPLAEDGLDGALLLFVAKASRPEAPESGEGKEAQIARN